MHYFEAGIYESADTDGNEYFFSSPWGQYYDLQWYFNGEPIDGVERNGTYVIYKDSLTESGTLTCEITNQMLCTSSDSVEIFITGIDDEIGFIDEQEIRIFPNPSNGIINIEGLNPEISRTLSIYNTMGNKILTQDIKTSFLSLDLYSVPSGMYIVKVENKDGTVETFKVTKR